MERWLTQQAKQVAGYLKDFRGANIFACEDLWANKVIKIIQEKKLDIHL